MRAGRVLVLRPRETVTSEGDEDPRIFGVSNGTIGTYSSHRHQFPVLGTILVPGQWFGIGPRLIGGGRTLTFIAMENSELLCFGETEWQQIAAVCPELQDRLAQLAQMMSNYSNEIVAELLIPKTERRIVAVLLRLCERSSGEFSFPLSQTQLAEMANASRSSVNTIIKTLENAGLVTAGYGRISVTNHQGLARWYDLAAARDNH